MDRAYSLFEIKEVDESTGTIRGIATTPTPDRMGDIVRSEGAEYQLPIPFLWQHDSRSPMGSVVEARVTKSGIEVVAEIALGVTEEIDRAWKLIKAGLVRGLSIGFRGLEIEEIPNSWGVIFEKWEWLELSAVTIPAQAEATISRVKSIDREIRGQSGDPDPRDPAAMGRNGPEIIIPPGASGRGKKTTSVRLKEAKRMTLAEQIAAYEQRRSDLHSQMESVAQKSIDEGRSMDGEEQEQFDDAEAEVIAIDSDLKRLRTLERIKAQSAAPVDNPRQQHSATPIEPGITPAATAGRTPAQVKMRERREPGIGLARVAKCLGMAQGNRREAFEIAKGRYNRDDAVVATLKAAVEAGTTDPDSWTGDLVGDETSVFADFVEYLRPMTILGRFGSDGRPSLRQVPFRTPLIGQTGGGSGYWVGEGKPKPLTSFDFNRTTLGPLKVANIAVVTNETLNSSSPAAEGIIRDSLAAALQERLDIDFVDPGKAAVAGVSPASITNGVTAIASSGNEAADVREDIRRAFNAFITASNAPTTGVWVMSAQTALALSIMQNPLGQAEFTGISMAGGTLSGLPVITSEYVPTDSSGSLVMLVNAQDVYVADDGGVRVDMSREASLQMDDAPGTQDATTGTGTNLVSLWQTNSVGFLAERTINWAKRRPTAVAVIDGVNWGLPAGSV